MTQPVDQTHPFAVALCCKLNERNQCEADKVLASKGLQPTRPIPKSGCRPPMANEQWKKMVEATEFYSDGLCVCRSADVVTLLARQHRGMVRKIKRLADQSQSYDVQEFTVRLLAALAKQGGRGKKK